MEFRNGAELLELCAREDCLISQVMRRRECEQGETAPDRVEARMARALEIMRESATQPLKTPVRSMGGLIGGEAKRLATHAAKKKALCGPVLQRAITYAMAVLEVNASMGLIVAAPTAGSSGVVPGLLLALQDEYHISDERLLDSLFNAGAVGYLAMRNATVAGAVGGCQAEVGVAAAMAASAAVELMGGTPKQSLDAASTVMMNMLGLVCDPVGGLVEYPCQSRNAAGVANALVAAELALSGVPQLIPFDEMLAAMYNVGRRLPAELRETALGGCAVTPSACARCGGCG
ncbi:MAG: L-serine ammonia-lyase, iron-sulfur-dependent, subunit alpha [Bacteroidales bacterium]|nr:L-serine ammonia-lyase, iron-sulfur-dependent, subunit alpha [Fournierella massiliensis]MCF2556604.1 L-serine ammonia-lyase, iron-sulfur-dependent, subunit alpha [Fournierella massiliensis]MCI6740875.1 L-serine ammonia-lyase, iron-sulfur-dependent, subunit alpha [Bacteroidales bacterium]